MKNSFTELAARKALYVVLLLAVPVLFHHWLRAQAPSRYLGAVTAINGTTLTVKTDAGEVHQVDVPSTTVIKQVAPGQKDLSTAVAIQFNDLATGDRVLVRLDPNATGATPTALQIIAIKQADVAQKQQKDREDWQRRGVGGLVKSVDTGAGVITLTTGAGPTAKTITVNTTKATVLERYAPSSVSFDLAKPAPMDAIHAGDQLRARGAKSADGTQIAAEEVVSGSFRNLSGLVTVVDAATSTIQFKDLATKKQVTVHITPDAQMRRLPDRMAQMLATRLKGGATPPATAATGGQMPGGQARGASASGGGQFGGGQGGGGQFGADPQQMFNRAPLIQFADLKKGDAVMIVSGDGTTDFTAITLMAGVEPLLEAPAASNLLSNWSMGSGAPEAQ